MYVCMYVCRSLEKDCRKKNSKPLQIDVQKWERKLFDRKSWQQIIKIGCSEIKEKKIKHGEMKLALCKGDSSVN